jgi:hypothetical protein
VRHIRDAHDQTALGQAAALLEVTGRQSQKSAVGLHALSAAQLLADAGIQSADSATYRGDQACLREALRLFGTLSVDPLRDDDVLDALRHALLAHTAAR